MKERNSIEVVPAFVVGFDYSTQQCSPVDAGLFVFAAVAAVPDGADVLLDQSAGPCFDARLEVLFYDVASANKWAARVMQLIPLHGVCIINTGGI